MLDDADKAHISDLFVQVRGRADAYYKSALVPLADGLDGSFDPLQFLLDRSKGRFRIHAWMNVMYIWSSETDPLSKEHLLFKRPEWSAVSKNGLSMIDEGLEKLKDKNKEGFFFSPANDDFQEYFLSVVEDLVKRYPIDGVHLDYIRYAGKEYDYSESIRSKFILAYHVDPLAADSGNGDGPGFMEQKNWFYKSWSDFRRRELSDFVNRIKSKVKSIRADVKLSAAVWADIDMATNELFQEWPMWIQKGYLDFAVPMNYATDNKLFESRIQAAKQQIGDSLFSKNIVMGISMYNQKAQAMRDKVDICRKYGLRGISFFSYESVRKDKIYFKEMVEVGK